MPDVHCFFVQCSGPKDDKPLLVFGPDNGGADAENGPEVTMTLDGEGKTEKLPLYEWIGEGRRTLRFNGWRQGHDRGNPVEHVKFLQPVVLAPGDYFLGGVAPNSGRVPPSTDCVRVTQVNLKAREHPLTRC